MKGAIQIKFIIVIIISHLVCLHLAAYHSVPTAILGTATNHPIGLENGLKVWTCLFWNSLEYISNGTLSRDRVSQPIAELLNQAGRECWAEPERRCGETGSVGQQRLLLALLGSFTSPLQKVSVQTQDWNSFWVGWFFSSKKNNILIYMDGWYGGEGKFSKNEIEIHHKLKGEMLSA